MNPVYPNIVAYIRNQPGTEAGYEDAWLADLNTADSSGNVQAYQLNAVAGRTIWAPNGQQIGWRGTGNLNVGNVVTAQGQLNLTNGVFSNQSKVGPSTSATGLDDFYCRWLPDGTLFLCISSGSAKQARMIFLMSLDGTQTKNLLQTDEVDGVFDGGAKPTFTTDSQHIIYSANPAFSGSNGQVFTVTGFTESVP
jgi:hypothetical protein